MRKDGKRQSARTPRIVQISPRGGERHYAVAYGEHLFSTIGGDAPLGIYRCIAPEASPFYRKRGGDERDLLEVADDGCAKPGDLLVADQVKDGWLRVYGGFRERWLSASLVERVSCDPQDELQTHDWVVPPGWEILTWQGCQGAVLKMVLAAYEWESDVIAVQDAVRPRFLAIGSKRHEQAGALLGDALDVVARPGGQFSSSSSKVMITRPMVGLSWTEDMFDVAGLLHDSKYLASAVAPLPLALGRFSLAKEAHEAGQGHLSLELRGWFAPKPPTDMELMAAVTKEARALRSFWATEHSDMQLRMLQKAFLHLPDECSDPSHSDSTDAANGDSTPSWSGAADLSDDIDPVHIWIQVALGSILELAACVSSTGGPSSSSAFERLIARATRAFAGSRPLALFGVGSISKTCVVETVAALQGLVDMRPELLPVSLEMLLALASATGSARLIAQAVHWLLLSPDDSCARRCAAQLDILWQLGSVMHFEVAAVVDDSDAGGQRKRHPSAWRFLPLSGTERPAPNLQWLRSYCSISFDEPIPGGVYWEVCVAGGSGSSCKIAVGCWLESKRKVVGCMLADASPLGAGVEVVRAADAPEVQDGSMVGILVTNTGLSITCDGRAFAHLSYGKLVASGERLAVFVEQGVAMRVNLNVGQQPMRHRPAGAAIWGTECDQVSADPFHSFASPPATAKEVVDILMRITERNVGKLGTAVDSGSPVQHTFTMSDQMHITEDGTVVSNLRENAWARTDCEIRPGVSVEFSFEVLDDRENDEGTCYGISTPECYKYDSRGSFVLRGYSGHLYSDGADKGEKFPKIHPRNRVSFRFDYSEGKLEAWLDDQEPRVLVNDPSCFAGRVFYPTVFNYHGTRTKVKLLSCNSGLRNRSLLQDSFVLEVSAPATTLWVDILEQLVNPLQTEGTDALDWSEVGSKMATVLKVLLATANMSSNVWADFGAVRDRLCSIVDFVVIKQRDSEELRKPREICVLLISVLGVGAFFGGPTKVVGVYLDVYGSKASRLGSTLASYLLRRRDHLSLDSLLLRRLCEVAMQDEVACQILLRLSLNAFSAGAVQFCDVATGVLELIADLSSEQLVPASDEFMPAFVSTLLVLHSQLLAVLPQRVADSLKELLALLRPVADASIALREAAASALPEIPWRISAALTGLNGFLCNVAALLMTAKEDHPFPIDIGDAELLDSAAGEQLPDILLSAEQAVDELVGLAPLPPCRSTSLPSVVEEVLSATGRGEDLVRELHEGSRSKAPLTPVQRAAFAAAVLCQDTGARDAETGDISLSIDESVAAWEAAQVFTNNKVRPVKHAIAAQEGDPACFEADLAAKLTWLVKSVDVTEDAPPLVVTKQVLQPINKLIKEDVKGAPATQSTSPFAEAKVVLPSVQNGKMPLVGSPPLSSWRCPGVVRSPSSPTATSPRRSGESSPTRSLDLSKVQMQLVHAAANTPTSPDPVSALVKAAAIHRDVAVGRRTGLRLLRYVVARAASAEGCQQLLPSLVLSLEDILQAPLAGMEKSGVARKHATLEELFKLIHQVLSTLTEVSEAKHSPSLRALGVSLLCLPLPHEELEVLLESYIEYLMALVVDNGLEQGMCLPRAAMLVLRAFICSKRQEMSPTLKSLLQQLLERLPLLASRPTHTPVMTGSPLAALEVEWDFGSLGRLCPHQLAWGMMLWIAIAIRKEEDANHELITREQQMSMGLTLKALRRHLARGTLGLEAALNLALRFHSPQSPHDEPCVDLVEVLQLLRAARQTTVPWPDARQPGACAAVLCLLRPVADLLSDVSDTAVGSLLQVASAWPSHRLAACLAISLYSKMQLPDERIEEDVPKLLVLLRQVPPSLRSLQEGTLTDAQVFRRHPGAIAFSSVVLRLLRSRAPSLRSFIRQGLRSLVEALESSDLEDPFKEGVPDVLEVVGGPPYCSACHMQVLNTSSGRSLVVGADGGSVCALPLDATHDVQVPLTLDWEDLPAPAKEVQWGGHAHLGGASLWGDEVVSAMLLAYRKLVTTAGKPQVPLSLLRCLAQHLPMAPQWEATVARAVLMELDALVSEGVTEALPVLDLLEHHVVLMRIRLQDRDPTPAMETLQRGMMLPVPATTTTKPIPASAMKACQGPECTIPKGASDGTAAAAATGTAPPPLLQLLNQPCVWQGKYKIQRHTNTWFKAKWCMEMMLHFQHGGGLEVVAKWPKHAASSTAKSGTWCIDNGLQVRFELELPGRREGGRTRDTEVCTWQGHLVQSRGCPHLEGTASGKSEEAKYEWYSVPPDALSLIRAPLEYGLFGSPDDGLPRPFSLLRFNTSFVEHSTEHFKDLLGMLPTAKATSSPRDLAVLAVEQCSNFQYITGPRDVSQVVKQTADERWGLCNSVGELQDDDGWDDSMQVEEKWRSVAEVWGASDNGGSSTDIKRQLQQRVLQMRYGFLMRILRIMLSSRPPEATIASAFPDPLACESVFKRVLRFPDYRNVLKVFSADVSTSRHSMRSALTVALEGLLSPFMPTGEPAITVESDHDYHPDEHWTARVGIPGATRMKLRWDPRCKMEQGKDYIQLYSERDSSGNFQGRLHTEEKLSGNYPTGFPDLVVLGSHFWLRFESAGVEQSWGFKFTLSGEGGEEGCRAAPFSAALHLLVAVAAKAVPAERRRVQLLAASMLLSIAVMQPLSEEASQAAEALCNLQLPVSMWSDSSWASALSLMSVAETNGRRRMLVALVTLLSQQAGPPRPPLSGKEYIEDYPMYFEALSPEVAGGFLMHNRTMVVSTSDEMTLYAVGAIVPRAMRAEKTLFQVHLEECSSAVRKLCIGVVWCGEQQCLHDLVESATLCDVTEIARPGEVLCVAMHRGSPKALNAGEADNGAEDSTMPQVVVTSKLGSVQAALPRVLEGIACMRPMIAIDGPHGVFSLHSDLPDNSHQGQAGGTKSFAASPSTAASAAQRLQQLQRTALLVEACNHSDPLSKQSCSQVPAALVVGAYLLREGIDEDDLRQSCKAVVESEHPHAWVRSTQKLHIPGASAIEVVCDATSELCHGHSLQVTTDLKGQVPVMQMSQTAPACSEAVVHKGQVYSALDGANPDDNAVGQQADWQPLPRDCEVCPADPDTMAEVAAKHTWSTSQVITSSGAAFHTAAGQEPGLPSGANNLLTRSSDLGLELKPREGPARILVRRQALKPQVVDWLPARTPSCSSSARAPVVLGDAVYVHGPVREEPTWGLSVRRQEGTAASADGPRLLVRQSADGAGLLQSASNPWVQQLATQGFVAELGIRQLVGEASLTVGIGILSGAAADFGIAWTCGGELAFRWNTGMCPQPPVHMQSRHWKFGQGDLVGFALLPSYIHLLRNGAIVHSIPQGQGLITTRPDSDVPDFLVSARGSSVLELAHGAQYPFLCFDAAPKSQPRNLLSQKRLSFRGAVLMVRALIRLMRRAFAGSSCQWGALPVLREESCGCSSSEVPGGVQVSEEDMRHLPPLLISSGEVRLSYPSGRQKVPVPTYFRAAADAPYTIEARVRVSQTSERKFMSLLTMYDDSDVMLDTGLCVNRGLATPRHQCTSKTVCDSEWHHVACTFDGKSRSLWIDGEQQEELPQRHCASVSTSAEVRHGTPSFLVIADSWTKSEDNASTAAPGAFEGEAQSLRIWAGALTAAQLRSTEAAVQHRLVQRAAAVTFEALQQAQTIGSEESSNALRLSEVQRLLRGCCDELAQSCSEGMISAASWLDMVQALHNSCAAKARSFLKGVACALREQGISVDVHASEPHIADLTEAMGLSSDCHGWRVEARPTHLTDAVLDQVGDEGFQQFRRHAWLTKKLLGKSADEAIVELVDKAVLSRTNHDDGWSKAFAVSEWPSAGQVGKVAPLVKQAIARLDLDHVSFASRLAILLAWHRTEGATIEALAADCCKEHSLRERLKALCTKEQPFEAWGRFAQEMWEQDVDLVTGGVRKHWETLLADMLFVRFLMLLELNHNICRDIVALVDLSASTTRGSWHGQQLLRQVKPRLFGHVRYPLFQRVLANSKYDGNVPSIMLNRKLSLSFREKNRTDWAFKRCLLGQLMEELRKQSCGPKTFRRSWQCRCLKVAFKGEGGEDAGGLYREALDGIAQELHSTLVPLFVPCPNAIAEVGGNRDAWVLNPRAVTPECINALEFLGQLLGLALRTGDLLPLMLAPFVWKGLIGEERTAEDARSIDALADRQVAEIVAAEELERVSDELRFVYPDVTGEEMELVEGGRDINITAENVEEFARLVRQNRVTFDQVPLAAIRRGLATVVPVQLLRLWSWQDLRDRICGAEEVDIDALKRHTTYKSCSQSSEHVSFMWQALESFTNKQRRSFLRFVWGRSCLPTVDKWERNFTVQLLLGSDDTRLPCSHTCFFTLDLPMYSSAEVCKAKILYCITNCMAIDADGAAARSLNWDEEDVD